MATGQTDANGQLTLVQQPIGTYKVEVTSVPAGLRLPPAQQAQVVDGQSVTVTFQLDEAVGTIVVVARGPGGVPVPGVGIQVTKQA